MCIEAFMLSWVEHENVLQPRGQGPFAQSIDSLTSTLRGQLVTCFRLYNKNNKTHLYFLLWKWEKTLHFFFNKNIGVFEILSFEILSNSYTMIYPPVRWDNPRALVSKARGLSPVQAE